MFKLPNDTNLCNIFPCKKSWIKYINGKRISCHSNCIKYQEWILKNYGLKEFNRINNRDSNFYERDNPYDENAINKKIKEIHNG